MITDRFCYQYALPVIWSQHPDAPQQPDPILGGLLLRTSYVPRSICV